MKKTTKTILALGLCFSFLYNCSTDDSFSEEIEGAIITETIQTPTTETTKTTTTDTSKTTIQENLSDVKIYHPSELAGKTEDWFNELDDSPYGDDPEQTTVETMTLIVEFATNLTAVDKTAARTRYTSYLGFMSYTTCNTNSNREIWTLNKAIYEDDSIPPPSCSNCTIIDSIGGPGPTGATKETTINEDPDFNKVRPSATTTPCAEVI